MSEVLAHIIFVYPDFGEEVYSTEEEARQAIKDYEDSDDFTDMGGYHVKPVAKYIGTELINEDEL